MQDSLLWVYEGQTQYWGQVLAARSGLWSAQQALDEMAYTAAYYQLETGRQWRPLEDTTNDEIINPRRPQSWTDWQRFEDYYEEGKLVWLEADTLIREQSGGKRSLDDFARAFFGINDGSVTPVTYTIGDVIKALNAVQPYDWASFLRQRVDAINKDPPLEGLARGGYRLVYTDAPSAILAADDTEHKRVDLLFSIGLMIDDDDKTHPGMLKKVVYNGAAFKAKLTEGGQILAVNGIAYEPDVLKDAIRAAKVDSQPIELIVRTGDRFRAARVDYHDGLRYPHLERQGTGPALLDEILAPRP
jgi:predicted metalloprotease with PDZ domain